MVAPYTINTTTTTATTTTNQAADQQKKRRGKKEELEVKPGTLPLTTLMLYIFFSLTKTQSVHGMVKRHPAKRLRTYFVKKKWFLGFCVIAEAMTLRKRTFVIFT